MNGEELPASVRMGQRLTGMTAFQRSFPIAGSQFEFARHGKSGGNMVPADPDTAHASPHGVDWRHPFGHRTTRANTTHDVAR